MQSARQEYERIVSREIVQRGLRKNVPPAAHQVYAPGDFTYVYRDYLKHYTGPHMVARVEGKAVFLHVGEATGPRQFNIAQLKPCTLPHHPSAATHITPLSYAEIVHHTEVLEPQDPRNSEFSEEDVTFRVIKRNEAGPNPKILPTRMVRAIKHLANGTKRKKSPFVLGGHRDRAKRMIVHSSNTLRQKSVLTILAIAAILDLEVWNSDIKQAYLQADVPLQRAIYCRPHLLNLDNDEIAQIVLPLYALTDSGEYWLETLAKHHLKDLDMKQSLGDFSLFYRSVGGNLACLSGTYVDDILHAATVEEKAKIMKKMKEKFEMTSSDDDIFAFIGLQIDSSDRKLLRLSQREYIQRRRALPRDASFELFRSARAKISWTVHSRPDVAVSSSITAQHTSKSFDITTINFLNKIIKYLQSTADISLQFPKLDPDSLRFLVYVDASFSNCKDAKSQLGHIILLADKTNRCAIIDYQSHKSRRTASSTSTAEAFAFVHGFDHAFLIRHDLQMLLGRPILILMLTDSDILFRNLTQARYTSERRLMIDINSAREAYNDRKISNIALIKSEFNPADAITKIGANDALLRLMKTHRIAHPLEQFIVEPSARNGLL